MNLRCMGHTMDLNEIERRWQQCRTTDDKRQLWEDELALGGWFQACCEAVRSSDEATLIAWLQDRSKQDIIGFPDLHRWRVELTTFGELSPKEMVCAHLVSALGALGIQQPSTAPPSLPPAFLRDLTETMLKEAMPSRSRRASDAHACVLFPLVPESPRGGSEGIVAKFVLELLPDGSGEVFLNPQQAFLPLHRTFQTIFRDAPAALRRMLRGAVAANSDVRVTIDTFNPDNRARLWSGLKGASGGGALALGLWRLTTGQRLVGELVGNHELVSSFCLTGASGPEPDGRCHCIGDEVAKALVTAGELRSRPFERKVTFLVAYDQPGDVERTALSLGLEVQRAGDLREAAIIASGRKQVLAYLTKFEEKCGRPRFLECDRELSDLYVPVRGAHEPVPAEAASAEEEVTSELAASDEGDKERDPLERYEQGELVLWHELRPSYGGDDTSQGDEGARPWIGLGDVGAGKTTWLRYEALTTAREIMERQVEGNLERTFHIPVWFDAKDFEVSFRDAPLAFLKNKAGELLGDYPDASPVVKRFIKEAWQTKRCIVFCDSLDEAEPKEKRPAVVSALRAIAKEGCPVYVTCRTSAWQRDFLDDAAPFHLAPFVEGDIESFVRSWFKGDPSQAQVLLETLDEKPQVARLAHNPLMLTLLCYTLGLRHGPVPDTQAALLESCLGEILNPQQRRRPERSTPSDYEFAAAQKMPLLQALGWQWMEEGKAPVEEAKLCQMFPKMDNISRVLTALVDFDGILKRTTEGLSNYYDFSLAVFGELLAASHLVKQADWQERLVPIFKDTNWHSVLPLAAGLLANTPTDASWLVTRLAAFADGVARGTEEYVEGLDTVGLARTVVLCLLEIPPSSTLDVNFIWFVVLRGIEIQQRKGREEDWQKLGEPGLVDDALSAAQIHMPNGGAELARSCLESMGRGSADRTPLPLLDLTASPCPLVRWLGLWLIGRLGANSLVKVVEEKLRDSTQNPHVRALAARVLVRPSMRRGREAPEGTIGLVARILAEEPDDEVAAGAAIALGRLGTERVLNPLLEKVESASTSMTVRIAIVGALDMHLKQARATQSWYGEEQRRRIAAVLCSALQEKDPRYVKIRTSAASALGKLRWADALEMLKQLATSADEHPEVRSSACYALGQLVSILNAEKKEEVKELFRELLARGRSEPPGVRITATYAEGQLRDRDALDALLEAAEKDENDTVVFNSLIAITRFADEKEVVQALLERVRRFGPSRFSLFVDCLARHPSPTGGKVFASLWQDPDDDVVVTVCNVTRQLVQELPSIKKWDPDRASKLAECMARAVPLALEVCFDQKRTDRLRAHLLRTLPHLARANPRAFDTHRDRVLETVRWCAALVVESPEWRGTAAWALSQLVRVSGGSFEQESVRRIAEWSLTCLSKPCPERTTAFALLGSLVRARLFDAVGDPSVLSRAATASMSTLESGDVTEQASALVLIQALASLRGSPFGDDDLRKVGEFCVRCLSHRDARMRSTACGTLGYLDLVRDPAPLAALLGDQDPTVRHVAQHAICRVLGRIHEDITRGVCLAGNVQALAEQCIALACHYAPTVGASALCVIQAMARRKGLLPRDLADKAAETALGQAATRKDIGALTTALSTVQRLGFTRYLKTQENCQAAVKCAYRRLSHSAGSVRAAAAGILSALGNAADVTLLEQRLARETSEVARESINYALGRLDSSRAVPCPSGARLGQVTDLKVAGDGHPYGFIESQDQRRYYFNPSHCLSPFGWGGVRKGLVVAFEVIREPEGTKAGGATRVRPAQRRGGDTEASARQLPNGGSQQHLAGQQRRRVWPPP